VRALVVYAHPVKGSYASALRDRVVSSLASNGHDVDLLDLYAEGFVPELSAPECRQHLDAPAAKPALAEQFERLRRAQALVLVYPTWWSGPPAILKGWFDRVWANEVAFVLPPGSARVRGRLHDLRRLVVVTTHGSSKLVNAAEGESGKRMVGRPLRLLCHRRARLRWVAFYGMDTATPDQLTGFLDRAAKAVARL
jgi:NAD(P)H dehydrogenase (quinone)